MCSQQPVPLDPHFIPERAGQLQECLVLGNCWSVERHLLLLQTEKKISQYSASWKIEARKRDSWSRSLLLQTSPPTSSPCWSGSVLGQLIRTGALDTGSGRTQPLLRADKWGPWRTGHFAHSLAVCQLAHPVCPQAASRQQIGHRVAGTLGLTLRVPAGSRAH